LLGNVCEFFAEVLFVSGTDVYVTATRERVGTQSLRDRRIRVYPHVRHRDSRHCLGVSLRCVDVDGSRSAT
jgi:hypothetical protein